MPRRTSRVDVGTWGRAFRCPEDRNRGKAKLENTKGIGHPIPRTFVPTSPRLPEWHRWPTGDHRKNVVLM